MPPASISRESRARHIPAILLALLLGVAAAPAGRAAEPETERLPRLDTTGMVIPWEDFKKILEEIRRAVPTPTPVPPPVDFALSACQAEVVINPEETQARVLLQLSVDLLNPDRWAEIPLLSEGMAMSRVEVDRRPASVYVKNGQLQITLRGAGRHPLLLEYLVPVSDSRGTRSIRVRFPAAPAAAIDIIIPRPRLEVGLAGGVVQTVTRSATQTRVHGAIASVNSDALVSWSRQVEVDDRETRVMGELHTLLSVGEGVMRGTAGVHLTVHGRGTDRVRLSLPGDVTVLDVAADGLRDWAVAPGGSGESVLTVRLNHLAQGQEAFQVSFEQRLAGETAATRVPDIVLLDVMRDKGFVAVAAATNVEISPAGEVKNAVPVDPAELPPALLNPAGLTVLYGFKYLAHPVEIGLQVVRHDDLAVKRTIVESARLFSYLSPEGKLITAARYTVKNNRKQYLELRLPAGAEAWGAYLEDRPVKAALGADGAVLIPLKKTAAGAGGELQPFEVELVYFQRRTAHAWGRMRFAGPALDVDALEVGWHLFLPRDRRYSGFGGNLHPDDELNRLVYVDRVVYNLSSSEDRGRLAGQRRLAKDKGLEEDLKSQLEALGYVGGQDADANAAAGAGGGVAGGEAAPAGSKRDRLENEIDRIAPRKSVAANAPATAERMAREEPARQQAMPQATQAWRGDDLDTGAYAAAAGRARGVLPVRFAIPVDGLRLSFGGRILTGGETPEVVLSAWPLGWTLPGGIVFLLALILTAVVLWLRAGPGSDGSTRRGLAPALLAAAGLLLLYLVSPERHAAYWLGLLLAAGGFFAARVVGRLWGSRGAATTLVAILLCLAAGDGWTRPADAAAGERALTAAGPALPDLEKTEITLAWKDFKALVERTWVAPPVEPPPPAEVFLRSAEYEGRLSRGALTLDGTLSLEVLKKGWARLPLGLPGGSVLSFQGGGALLNRNGAQLEVLAKGPASYTLRASLVIPATDQPGENRLMVALPEAPRNLINLAADPVFRDLQIEAGLAYARRAGRLFVALPGGSFAMKYTLPFRRAEEKAGEEVKLQPRVQLEAYQMLRLGEGVLSGILIHDYRVRVARVDHFDIDLPAGVVVFDAGAPGLESWKILQRDGRRFLRLKLLAPAEGALRAVINFEGTYDAQAGTVTVPRFAPIEVERESGFVAVGADGAEVDLRLSGNLLPADVSEIPPAVAAVAGALLGACKYSGAPDRATVTIREHADAPVLTAIIESLNATAIILDNGTEATWVDLVIRNNRKQFLGVRVPGGAIEIWSLLLNGEPAKPKRTGDDILIPLPRGDAETTSRIGLVLLRQGAALGSFGTLRPWLPRFDVPVSEALWTLYLPEQRRYRLQAGPFRPVVATAGVTGESGGRSVLQRTPASAPAGMESALRDEAKKVMAGVVSESTAYAQAEQEAAVEEQIRKKQGARKGTLPVRIGLPGGIQSLPRLTVSRILIVGDESNEVTLRAYPEWIGAALAALQRLWIVGAAILLGFAVAGRLGRRPLRVAAAAALVGLIPFGGIGPLSAFFLLLLIAAATWGALLLQRRLRSRRA